MWAPKLIKPTAKFPGPLEAPLENAKVTPRKVGNVLWGLLLLGFLYAITAKWSAQVDKRDKPLLKSGLSNDVSSAPPHVVHSCLAPRLDKHL